MARTYNLLLLLDYIARIGDRRRDMQKTKINSFKMIRLLFLALSFSFSKGLRQGMMKVVGVVRDTLPCVVHLSRKKEEQKEVGVSSLYLFPL